jgi:hypothetical protein
VGLVDDQEKKVASDDFPRREARGRRQKAFALWRSDYLAARMERRQMAVVIPDISPADLLARFRGPVLDSRPTYPERVHLEVRDAHGGKWCLATWWADYSPADPAALLGKTVTNADLKGPSGDLTIGFSDGSAFKVISVPREPGDDIETWELFTPEGLVLAYGPEDQWQLCRASDPC